MNVVIMLLTTVSAGSNPAPAPPAAHPAPVASSCGGSCGAVSDCCVSDCCCEKPKRSRSRKSKDCCCEVVSCCPAPCAQPCCAPACQPSCAPACCAPACPPASCGATSCCQPACCEPVCCEKPKRRGLFSRRKKDCCEEVCCDSCAAPSCCGAPAHGAPVHAAPAPGAPVILAPAAPIGTPVLPNKAVEPIKKMPSSDANKGASLAPLSPVTPAGVRIQTESKNPFESARRHEPSVSHTADYGRLTGQLSYVHADGGLWVLRYAPLSQEDANGGSVVLARDRVMSDYKEGDIVTVEGRVISQKGSTRLGGPLYQIQQMRLVNRPSN